MIKKCVGCGAVLQDNNELLEGYTTNIRNDYCMRCFRMRNYGEYEFVTKSNEQYINILKKIGDKKSLVLYIVDILSIPNDLNKIRDYLKNNKIILVLNKMDILPSFVNFSKVLDYFSSLNLSFSDIVFVSSSKGYNLDYLYTLINNNLVDDNCYVVGNTNAGKSTLISKLISLYTVDAPMITISPMPSTTLNSIEIPFNGFTLVDTPGLVDEGNILNYVDKKMIKKISPKKMINPRTYRINKNEALVLGDILRIDYVDGDKNSFTFFISDDIDIKKVGVKNISLTSYDKKNLSVKHHNDIVINGLGFIKVIDDCKINIYINKDIDVFTRKSLI